MGKPHYMPLYGNDWRSGTEDMESQWRGPYLDLCWIIFDQGGRIPNIESALARHARLGTRKFRTFWKLYGHKFIIDGDQIGHRKVDDVISSLAKVSAKLRENGRKGGQKTQQKQRRQSSPAKAKQTKGLFSPYREKTNRLDRQIPEASESVELVASGSAPQPAGRGGGLPDSSGAKSPLRVRLGEDGYRLWQDLSRDLQRKGLSIFDIDQIKPVLIGYGDGAFIIDREPLEGKRWQAVQETALAEGLSFNLQDQPRLKAIPGGKA